jgi:hypothetical protein
LKKHLITNWIEFKNWLEQEPDGSPYVAVIKSEMEKRTQRSDEGSTVDTTKVAYKILFDHKVDSFRASILGATLGTLIDRGLTDTEILSVVQGFCAMIRAAAKDPRMMEALQSQAAILGDATRAG